MYTVTFIMAVSKPDKKDVRQTVGERRNLHAVHYLHNFSTFYENMYNVKMSSIVPL